MIIENLLNTFYYPRVSNVFIILSLTIINIDSLVVDTTRTERNENSLEILRNLVRGIIACNVNV